MGDFNLVFWKVRYRNLVTTFYYLFRAVISFLPLTNTNLREFRGNSASLIDNIFVNNPDCVSVSGNIISDVSDHFSQFCIFRSARDRIKPAKRKMRDFTNFDRDSFTQDLNQIDWQSIIANGSNNIWLHILLFL